MAAKKKAVVKEKEEPKGTQVEHVKLNRLVQHPAQMRTIYAVDKMAELTLQMLTRGFDADKSLLVRPKGRGYELIRGHRRRMAWLMTQHLESCGVVADSSDIESVSQNWEDLLGDHGGDILEATAWLVGKCGKITIPVIVSGMNLKDSLSALWSDNYGGAKPDMMGEAISFYEGVRAGYTVRQISSHIGQGSTYVESRVSLAQIDPQLAKRLVGGELGISLATDLMKLTLDKREAVTQYILAFPSHQLRVSSLKLAIKGISNWNGFEIPLVIDIPTYRNVARAIANLWAIRLDADPVQAWVSAFKYFYIYEGVYEVPYSKVVLMKIWMKAFGLSDGRNFLEVLQDYLPTDVVSCAKCPLMKLPKTLLRTDLISPALPCRMQQFRKNTASCMHGLAPEDPFFVRVPLLWATLETVEVVGNQPRVTDMDSLVTAYKDQKAIEAEAQAVIKAQKDAEKAKAEKAAERLAKKEEARVEAAKSDPSLGDAVPVADLIKEEEPEEEPEEEVAFVERPIDIQRGQIALYMHMSLDAESLELNSPLSTSCSKCVHKMPEQEDDDSGIPLCAWAERPAPCYFSKIVDTANVLKPVPVCHQYMPSLEWSEIIPEYPGYGMQVPRSLMISKLRWFVSKQAPSSGGSSVRMFQWLTGRPMDNGTSYARLFDEMLTQKSGDLSDGQLFTLLMMAQGEVSRSIMNHMRIDPIMVPDSDITAWYTAETPMWDMVGEMAGDDEEE